MIDKSERLDARLPRRIQRHGWKLAADAYAHHWHGPRAGVQGELLTLAAPAPGEALLEVACGAGVVSVAAANAVGPAGRVLGVDLAEAMVRAARQRARDQGLEHDRFDRVDGEQLAMHDAGFERVQARSIDAIAPWPLGGSYRVPAEC